MVEADDDECARQVHGEGFNFLNTTTSTATHASVSNMIDPVIVGDTPELRERNRKLRQAISIAIDWEEYSKVFQEGRRNGDEPAATRHTRLARRLPEGVNPVTSKLVDGKYVRRSIEDARKPMVEAGYPTDGM
ncbi:MAG: hypothetical protein IPJ08_14085 [Burkholderiales bacterium]|nr:hypothetical protein [Burkholderiales bacterium]